MSTDDFAAELEQSVARHISDIGSAADRAKARVAESIAGVRPPDPAPGPDPVQDAALPPRGLVSFDDFEEPPADRSPMDDYAFPDPSVEGGELDADGIPVWEDPP